MRNVILIFLGLLLICLLGFPEAHAQSRPNILFVIADDAGTDYSAYGSTYVKTPAFDRIAKEGFLFNRAYTPNAKCAPSRACIITGRNSWQLDEGANHGIYFPSRFKSFMEVLGEHGYNTGFAGKGYAPGKALNSDGSPRNLLGTEYNEHKLKPPATGISFTDYAENFHGFLNESNGKPWAFWIGFNEPHRPYEFGIGERLGGKMKGMIKRVPAYWPDTDSVRTDMLDYAYEIEYADRQFAKILKLLEDAGQLQNTLVVFTSDHGMPFPRVKGNEYENANHIPLAVMWKGKIAAPGRKINDYVNFTDLAPTFLDVAGINWQQSGMHPSAGKSLLPIFTSTKNGQVQPERNYVLIGQERHDYGRPNDEGYPIRGIHKNGIVYLRNYEPDRWPACNPETGYLNCDGGVTKTFILSQRRSGVSKYYWKINFGKRPAEELYNTATDPDCMKNLIDDPKYKALAKQLRSEMEQKLKAEGDLRMIGYGHIYEQYPLLEVNGFYERYMRGEKIKTGWVNETDYEMNLVDDEGNDIKSTQVPKTKSSDNH